MHAYVGITYKVCMVYIHMCVMSVSETPPPVILVLLNELLPQTGCGQANDSAAPPKGEG